jgi:anthranilate synthase/aminodeoxychorismate synthase-like glutamine amidotransferase
MSRANILFIDNFDSFSFNLVDEFAARDCRVDVWRNDIDAEEALELVLELPTPRLLVLSPGPGTPDDAGCCVELVRGALGNVPIFGVCLGHQVLVKALGGVVGRAEAIVHGKASGVAHDGRGLFEGLPTPFPVGRYHSLAAHDLPDTLRRTAHFDDTVMAVEHATEPAWGVQFHPESILTTHGPRLIDNLLDRVG